MNRRRKSLTGFGSIFQKLVKYSCPEAEEPLPGLVLTGHQPTPAVMDAAACLPPAGTTCRNFQTGNLFFYNFDILRKVDVPSVNSLLAIAVFPENFVRDNSVTGHCLISTRLWWIFVTIACSTDWNIRILSSGHSMKRQRKGSFDPSYR